MRAKWKEPSKKVSLRYVMLTKLTCLTSERMVQALAEHHGDVPQITLEILKRDIFGAIPWIYVIVAEAEGKAVGYAALCPLIKLQMGLRRIDMHHLFVEAGLRGQGIANN